VDPYQKPYYLEPEKESQVKVVAKKTSRAIYVVLQIFIAIAITGMLLYLFVLPINIVDGPSMEPNFCDKDIYFTYKLESYFDNTSYERGDVIAFQESANRNLIKRIVGMPGDTIRVERGELFVNDELFDEPYFESKVITSSGNYLGEGETYIVPAGKYFAFGDNRPVSLDSRDIGPVDQISNSINGKVVAIIWPPQRMRFFDPNEAFAKDECQNN
jgi:signal peptidase I